MKNTNELNQDVIANTVSELSADELQEVSGGKSSLLPEYFPGQRIRIYFNVSGRYIHGTVKAADSRYIDNQAVVIYIVSVDEYDGAEYKFMLEDMGDRVERI